MQLNLRNKLLIAFLAIELLAIPIMVLEIAATNHVQHNFSVVVQKFFARNEALIKMDKISEEIRKLINTTDQKNSASADYEYEKGAPLKYNLLSQIEDLIQWESVYHSHVSSEDQNAQDFQKMKVLTDAVILKSFEIVQFYEKMANPNIIAIAKEKFNVLSIELAQVILNLSVLESENRILLVDRTYAKTHNLIYFSVGLFVLNIMVVLILSIFFANRLSKPIIALRNVSADVAKGNYASRAQVASSDEIGELAIDMNKMIESLVKKTNTLVQSNILLNTEIDERKRIETKNFELTNELVVASRNAGMVDTATNVLHNVGNVLNSVNTSISVIGEKINLSKMGNLSQLSDLIKTHEHDLGVFVTTDTKGKHLPKYLINLSGTWINEKEVLLHEVSEVHRNIEHIKNIISKQNALSTLIGVVEIVEISKLLDDAITLVQISPAQMKIKILKEYDSKKSIKVDRVKLFQVIVNLLKNSIEALLESNIEDPQLILRIEDEDQSTSVISIADNGVGISSENIKKIFTHGFTTKKTGHGFGLHMSAIAIQELGGALSMKSEGLGKGATFTIKLPYQALKVAGDQNAGYQSNPNLDS